MVVVWTASCGWSPKQGVAGVRRICRVREVWPRDGRGGSRPPTVQLPLQDAQRAIGLLRARASEYGLDPRKIGVIGFSAAIIGGLGSIYGAILGGFLFAALQTIGAVALPFASAYKDVFAFTVVIALMAWRPTGLIQEKISERG